MITGRKNSEDDCAELANWVIYQMPTDILLSTAFDAIYLDCLNSDVTYSELVDTYGEPGSKYTFGKPEREDDDE